MALLAASPLLLTASVASFPVSLVAFAVLLAAGPRVRTNRPDVVARHLRIRARKCLHLPGHSLDAYGSPRTVVPRTLEPRPVVVPVVVLAVVVGGRFGQDGRRRRCADVDVDLR